MTKRGESKREALLPRSALAAKTAIAIAVVLAAVMPATAQEKAWNLELLA